MQFLTSKLLLGLLCGQMMAGGALLQAPTSVSVSQEGLVSASSSAISSNLWANSGININLDNLLQTTPKKASLPMNQMSGTGVSLTPMPLSPPHNAYQQTGN